MSKVAVVYWSSTGNTEAMAEAVCAGAKGAIMVADAVICVESPDEDAIEQCKELGAALA